METARVGKVAVENTAYHFDKAYDYLIPQTLWAKAEKGCRVLVPFGGGNRTRQGLLMDVEEIRAGRTGSEEGLKSVKAVLDQTPLLSPEMLLLARWMKERYFCTLNQCLQAIMYSVRRRQGNAPGGASLSGRLLLSGGAGYSAGKAGSPRGGGKAADRLSFPVQAPRTQG